MTSIEADFAAPETIADPYPVLRRLQEFEPVHWNEGLRSWCLTRHADVKRAYQDPRLSAERITGFTERQQQLGNTQLEALGRWISLWLVFMDPPRHTRLRKLTQKAFTRRGVARMTRTIEHLINELLDQASDRREMDFVRDFAYPLPANVIADMLGVPREHVEDLKRWSDDVAQFVLTSRVRADRFSVAAESLEQMNALFRDLIAHHRRHPGDDLMDELIAARDDDTGAALSEDELLAFCVLLLFAGHETTTHLFSNGLRAFASFPDELAKMRALGRAPRPVENAVDEILRFDGPVMSVSRIAAEDLELGGRRIREGDQLYLFNAAANRDPRVFEHPEEFRVDRSDARRMVGFGYGIHLCLGIHLARLEAVVGFPILLGRLKDIELVTDAFAWEDTIVTRGVRSLPIRFQPA
jgi:cytochrome P450